MIGEPKLADETVLDLRGLLCPLPALRAGKALRSVPLGSVLVVACTDPMAAIDVPLLVVQTGNELVSQRQEGGVHVFRIVRRV